MCGWASETFDKTALKAALRFAVETLAADPRAVSQWLSGQPNRAQDAAAADLGIDAPARRLHPQGRRPRPSAGRAHRHQ